MRTCFTDLLSNNFLTSMDDDNWGFSFSDLKTDQTGSQQAAKFRTLPSPSLPLSPSPFSPSSFLSIPPGLSPTEFLNSSMFLPSPNIFPSPTVGTFAGQGFNWRSDSDETRKSNQREEKTFSDFSFQSKPTVFQSSTMFMEQPMIQATRKFSDPKEQSDFSSEKAEMKSEHVPNQNFSSGMDTVKSEVQSNSAPRAGDFDYVQSVREQRRSEDGYNWRKYGQKQVKGSENPRSYYKCTYPSCPMKKKVERSLEGQITEIVYKGSHNHPKPEPRRSNAQSVQPSSSCTNSGISDQSVVTLGNNPHRESLTVQEDSSVSVGEDQEFDKRSQMSNSGGDDDDENEPDAKRWKGEIESEGYSGSGNRTVREPRVVVQTTSEIDILDDGYRWRKYGQKVVKGNTNPRSYYKCTYVGCSVRKHVERASHDLRAVITTYEGKHNHDVPVGRGGGCYAMNKSPGSSNNTSNAPIPIKPSAISNYSNHASFTKPQGTRQKMPGSQETFRLEILQGPGNLGYSDFGRSVGPYENHKQYSERKDDSFFGSFLSNNY